MVNQIMSKIESLGEPIDLLFAFFHPNVDCVLTATSSGVTLFKIELTNDDASSLWIELAKLSKPNLKKEV